MASEFDAFTPTSTVDHSRTDRAALIAWLSETSVDAIMDEAAQRLASGVAEDALWAACGLTASRYINNQAHNLMGFVSHAMIGCEDARRLAAGQPQRTRYLLLMQCLNQVVMDLHDPCFSPWEMLPFAPLYDTSVDENMRNLRVDVRFGEYSRADHRFVGLAETLPRADLLDLLMEIGLEGITVDDHTLISPVLSLGFLELIGWGAGFEMLRWAIRYSASFPRHIEQYERAVALRRLYDLEQGVQQVALQPDKIQPLRAAFHAASPHERPEIAAQALAQQQCSPATVRAAAAQTAADLYLQVDPVPHEDFDAISREVAPIHINNCLRSVGLGLRYMQPTTQALAAIQCGSLLERGPTIIDAEFAFAPFEPCPAYPYAEDLENMAGCDASALLDRLNAALLAHDCRAATAAVCAYGRCGGDPERLIRALTQVACTDHGTLLHNIKHLNSTINEFRQSNHPDRWNFLMTAAKFVSWYAGLDTGAYERADHALAAHCDLTVSAANRD